MQEEKVITKNLIGVGGGAILANKNHDFGGIGTEDAYSDVGAPFKKKGLLTTTIVLENTGGAEATYKILGSVDGGKTFVDIFMESTVAAGETIHTNIIDYFDTIKVQAKSSAAATPTTVKAKAAAIAG